MIENTKQTQKKYRLTFDVSTKHIVKPTNPGLVSRSLTTVKEVTVEGFAKGVTFPYGYSFTPAVFKDNKRKNANWEQQSIFALDFDDGLTPEKAIKIANDYGINPSVVYTSFSDSPAKRKFRVLFFLDKVITDAKEAKFIILNLMNMYEGQADKACKDYARLFFGGKECLLVNNEVISYTALMEVLNTIQIANDSMKTRKMMSIENCPKRTNPIIYNNDSPFETKIEGTYNEGNVIKDFDFGKAASEVLIFNDFLNLKWLSHPELFGIATNLRWIKGGLKLMKSTMIKANDSGKCHYGNNNFGILPYVSRMDYTPQRLENFSPYDEDVKHLNIINSVRTLQGEIVSTVEVEKITLSDAEIKLEEEFTKALAADKGIFLFKLPTGLGKTRRLESVEGVTIALPTHKLKDEVSDRMKVTHLCSPQLPKFEDSTLNDKISFFYRTGLISKATGVLNKVAANEGDVCMSDVIAAREYKTLNVECFRSKDTVLTTHQKAMFSDFNSDTLIFDEDPLQSILALKTLKIGDLISLEGQCDNKAEIAVIIDYLRNLLPAAQTIETPLFTIDIDALSEIIAQSTLDTNVIDFLNSDFILKDAFDTNVIHFINKRDLPENKKLIILSATASEFIYKKVFGDNLTIIDLIDVEQVGNVIQNTKYSYSRTSLEKKAKDISQIVGDLPTITFMQHKNKFNNPVETMHFGNCAGYDSLNGKDIAVVGTPHLSNVVYVMYAKALGLRVKPNDMTISYKVIEYNGFKFKFMAYENDNLRNIQLGLIESDLLQAVGRNRTLRKDATAYVYSNLPLRQTTQFTR